MTGKKTPQTLTAFVQSQKRAACAVCSLPEEIRAQLRAASKDITRRTIRAWLIAEYGKAPAESEMTRHSNGHHEEAE